MKCKGMNIKPKHTVHWNAHLCHLDVTVHLVVQLAHLELQQRERGDMSFRNKHALKQHVCTHLILLYHTQYVNINVGNKQFHKY